MKGTPIVAGELQWVEEGMMWGGEGICLAHG